MFSSSGSLAVRTKLEQLMASFVLIRVKSANKANVEERGEGERLTN